MLNKPKTWSNWARETVTPVKHLFANLSIKVRTSQFREFEKILKPNPKLNVLDVGVTSDETLKDANLFEKLYIWTEKLTAVTIEDSGRIKTRYPKIKVIKTKRGEKLPFKSKKFDIAVSWATLEHVGNRKHQQDFINDMLRVGKKIFVTTPFRGAPYEPHTGFWFLHWLPLKWFRMICSLSGNKFWGSEDNLNPLLVSDLEKMHFSRRVKFRIFKMFYFIPSHIIIST